MVLRPLSVETNWGSGESVWITVQVVGIVRQPLPSSAPELLLALSTSTRTVPTKVVWIAFFAGFNAIMSTLTVLPAILVLILPLGEPARVVLSYASKPPATGGVAVVI